MKNIYFILTSFIVLFSLTSNAQQIPHYTQYMYNMSVINPAYAGARADISAGVLARQQWVGLEGTPETETFFFNARTFDSVGMGFNVVQDQIGLLEDTNFNIDLSYTMVTSHSSRLAFGIKGGFSNYSNNLSLGLTPDNDSYADLSGTYPNAGFGFFYYTKNYYLGFSVPQLFNTPKFKLDPNDYSSVLNEHQSYFGTFGYVFQVNENVKFKPSTLIKYNADLPLSIDVNANVLFKNQIEFGVSYRYNDSVSGMIALVLSRRFRVGYSYDYTLTNLGNFNSGSHELMLLLDFDFKKRGRWLNDSSCYF
jgi:type IX secretion system PorP/SprF family membrane protein